MAQLRRAFQSHPNDPELYLVFGEWLEAAGQKDKAFEAFSKAVQLDPTFQKAREALRRLGPEKATKLIILAISRNLPKLNYYQLLGIDASASQSQIHAAYRDLSKQFHPDRFFKDTDPEFPHIAKETYKRMVEAFMVLKDPAQRKDYDELLLRTPKNKSIAEAPLLTPFMPHPSGPTTRQGKKFFNLALDALRNRDFDTAKLNLKLALQAEPDNPVIREKLEEISRPPS